MTFTPETVCHHKIQNSSPLEFLVLLTMWTHRDSDETIVGADHKVVVLAFRDDALSSDVTESCKKAIQGLIDRDIIQRNDDGFTFNPAVGTYFGN